MLGGRRRADRWSGWRAGRAPWTGWWRPTCSIAVVIAGLAMEAISTTTRTTLPVMLVLSLLGFAGSVSIARFVADRDQAPQVGRPIGPVDRSDARRSADDLADVVDVAGAVLLLLGAFLCLAAAVGLVRFPDVLSRMHAATKPQTLGLLLVADRAWLISLREPAVHSACCSWSRCCSCSPPRWRRTWSAGPPTGPVRCADDLTRTGRAGRGPVPGRLRAGRRFRRRQRREA